MALAVMSWMIAIPLLGFCTGLRAMTPIAVLCWFAVLGNLPVQGTWAIWTAKLVSALVFTALALAETVGDKLPRTPARTSLFPLVSRLAFGGLVGALAATALVGSAIEGILLGCLGALLGSFAGLHYRHAASALTHWPDWRFAVLEDLFAIACSVAALAVVNG